MPCVRARLSVRAYVYVCVCEKNGKGWKNGGAGDDGTREDRGGGSGFCARDDKFGGHHFAPENLSQ